jgi:hypothetical protein
VNGAPIFIGGAARSGTTLVRVILDSHPRIACGPELKVTPVLCQTWHSFQTSYLSALQESFIGSADINQAFAQMILFLLDRHRQQTGKARAAEKSPSNVFVFEHLHHMFPESPLIHVIRDGRDVVCSLLTMNWIDIATGQKSEFTRDAGKAAAYWVRAVQAGRQAGRLPQLQRHYLELRYEDIVARPEPTLQRLFAFVGEPWDPVVLQFHRQPRRLGNEASAGQVSRQLYTTAAGRWQRDLNAADKQLVNDIAGDLLIELGYAVDRNW